MLGVDKKIITFIAGLVIGIAMVYLWGLIVSEDTIPKVSTDVASIEGEQDNIVDDSEYTQTEEGLMRSELISVLEQEAGSKVVVASVNMPNAGWVAVHEIKDGIIANALGASRLDEGLHVNIDVYLLRNSVPGGEYAVVLYNDDGDRNFNLVKDVPIKDDKGNFMMTVFKTINTN